MSGFTAGHLFQADDTRHTHSIHQAANHVHEFNPNAGLYSPTENTCPKCGKAEYLATRRGGCAECRGVKPPAEHRVFCACGCGTLFVPHTANHRFVTRRHQENHKRSGDPNKDEGTVPIDSSFIRALVADRRYSLTGISEACQHNGSWLGSVLKRGKCFPHQLPALAAVLEVEPEVLLK